MDSTYYLKKQKIEGFTYKTSHETIAKIDEATGKVTATGLGKKHI